MQGAATYVVPSGCFNFYHVARANLAVLLARNGQRVIDLAGRALGCKLHQKTPEPSPENSRNKCQQIPWNILNQPGFIYRLQADFFFFNLSVTFLP